MNTIQQFKFQSRKLLPYLRRYQKWAGLVIVFLLIKEAAILFEPVIYRKIVEVFEALFRETLTQEQAIGKTIFLLVLFLTAQSIVLVSNLLMLRWTNRLQSSVMRDAANDFVEKVLSLSFRFHSERKTGKLAKEFARGINGIEVFMDAFTFNLFPLFIRFSAVLTIYAFIDWMIALVLFVMIVLFCIFTSIASISMQRRRERANKFDDEGSRKAMDALMNAEAVKYFQKEREEIHMFQRVRQNWKQTKQSEWDGWSWISTGQIGMNVIAITSILAIMVFRLLHETLTLADFVFVISYLTLVIGMLWEFQHHIRRMQESFTDVTAFFYYFDQKNEIQDAPNATALQVGQGNIDFEQIAFSYHEGKSVIKELSFHVPAGKSVAFVGPSGVGKSTIIKLLYRFYDPQHGRILIDGQDIAAITQQSLREALSIVPQETALFNETIAYNIGYGKKNVSEKEVREAARLAHIDDFIMSLPEQYKTLVGERGIKLSGGEKQRISIARAFLRNSPILVLDEATSSLDSSAEAEIQIALRELMKGRTTLIIAHRLSTIMNADIIIVLNQGTIEQQGSHEELIQHGGLYQRLWELQAGGYLQE